MPDAARPRFDLIAAERRALADLADGFTAEQWATSSLCGLWTVREVVAHTMIGPTTSLPTFAVAMLRARGNFDRVNHRLAVDRASRPTTDLVALLRDRAEHRFSPPGFDWHAPLADILVHHVDIAVPLGLPLDRPVSSWAEVLPFLTVPKVARAFGPGSPPDVTWTATDLDFTHGSGPTVTGPAAVIGAVMCGRAAVLDRLEGPGADAVAAWAHSSP